MFVWFVKSIFTSCLGNSPSILAFRKGFERGGIRLGPMGVGQVSLTRQPIYRPSMCSTLSYKLALQCATYSYISNDLKQLPLFCWVVFSVVGWPTVIQVVLLARFQCSEIIAANLLWEDSNCQHNIPVVPLILLTENLKKKNKQTNKHRMVADKNIPVCYCIKQRKI